MNNQRTKRNISKLTYQLIKNGRIETGVVMAKLIKPNAERLINRAKKDCVAHRRYVAGKVPSDAVEKLFSVIGPAASKRNGGYTRILRTGPRKGDGSERCLIEIIDV